MKTFILMLALLCISGPALAVVPKSLTASTTTACLSMLARSITFKNDGTGELCWSCNSSTVSATDGCLQDGESFSAEDGCDTFCYKTPSGTAAFRIWYQPR